MHQHNSSDAFVWGRLAGSLGRPPGPALIHAGHPGRHLHIVRVPLVLAVMLTPVRSQRRTHVAMPQGLQQT